MRLWDFFFSSRRRHTGLQGDWSSDVCSSDLTNGRVSGSSVSKLPKISESHFVFPLTSCAWFGLLPDRALLDLGLQSTSLSFNLRQIGRASCRERV